jgi:hypothetical protein
MRSFNKYVAWAISLMALPAAVLTFAASTAGSARAERALDDSGDTAFKIFRSELGSRSRAARSDSDDELPTRSGRSRAASQSSDDDAPVRSRRTRVAIQSSSNDDQPAPSRRRTKGRQVASLGGGEEFAAPKPGRSLSGGGNITWAANAGCLNGSLRSAVAHVASSYGSVTVNSTCRSAGHNASVGGAPKSYHLSGDAVDLRVHGNISGAASYLASLGGGYKHYGGGLFHVDTGPRRPF